MSKRRPMHTDPGAQQAKKAVRRAMHRSKSRLDNEYPQLELRQAPRPNSS